MAAERARQGENEERQLDCYRRVRDEIRAFVEKMPENIVVS
jgi:arsenate reductase